MTNVAPRRLRLLAVAVALSLAAAALGAAPAAAAPGGPRGLSDSGSGRPAERGAFAPDQVLVKWAPGARATTRAAARDQHGIAHARSAPRTGVEVHKITTGRGPQAVARDLSGDPRVEYAQPNYVLRAFAEPPNDPEFAQLWGLHNTGQSIGDAAGAPGVDIDALDAWNITQGAEDVVVAVIDEGTDRDHPDLNANMWVNPDPGSDARFPGDLYGWDFSNDDASVFDPADGDAHGTHVSGTVAAVAGNGAGIAGAAPEATVMPLKFLGSGGAGFTSDAVLAVEYAAARGVRIANASWGGPAFDRALRDAIESSGMAFIAAAGNEGQDNNAAPSYPCNYDLPNVLCVAAVDNDGDLASYSNYGSTTVDVGAPGSRVLSTVPRLPDQTVALQIDAPAYDAMFWGFDLVDVLGDADPQAAMLRAALEPLSADADAPIMLVDDDESARSSHPDARLLYTQALTAAGFTNFTIRDVAPGEDGPSAAEMADRTVIWFTGHAYGGLDFTDPQRETTLTAGDQDNLTAFLDGGGSLLLAGADAILDIEDSAFVTDRLHADFVRDITGRSGVQGQSGTVFEGDTYALVSNEYIDWVRPANPAATEALTFPGDPTYSSAYSYFSGTSMAAPHATGVAALVAAVRPGLSGVEIVDLLKDTAVPLPSLSGATVTGGMVNASQALAAALGTPGAPTDVSAVAGDGQASVSWAAPADDGGSPITGYTVTAQPGGASVSVGGDARAVAVTGLTNGQSYTFTARATNASGLGPASAPSAPVTPFAVAGLPGAPTDVSAVAGDGQASVSWAAPADDGGSPITGYTVIAQPGGASVSVDGDARAATVTRLANGQEHTLTVAATNLVGDGPASAPSNAVTPRGSEACPAGGVPNAGFTDVAASNVHATAIDCVAWYALAQGTSASTFGPGVNVRRDQMASFIGRLVEEAGIVIDVSDATFTDVAGNVHAARINALAAAGIVRGVSPGVYAPGALVTRDQMASFLVRAYELIAEEALPTPTHGFTDVAGNVHATAITKAAGAEFARGLTATTYGPRQPVRRDQMASFLTRVLQRLVAEGLADAQS